MVNFPIDFVIPWVDGSDPIWLAKKKKTMQELNMPTNNIDDSAARYRDWGLLKYWFRGIENNAPWVNRIFLITDHQIPDWLEIENAKLKIISHEDYLPQDFLPAFSANPIELNLHRIKELSEHFVYFNDDIFLVNPVKPEDFFTKKGLPRTSAIASPLRVIPPDYFIMPLIDAAIVSEHFSFHRSFVRNLGKWLSPHNGVDILRTLLMLPYPNFMGFVEDHLANPYLKSTFEEVWSEEPEILRATSQHHLRTLTDVNQFLMREWQVASGKFMPVDRKIGHAYQLRQDWRDQLDLFRKDMLSRKYKVICINDSVFIDNVDLAISLTQKILNNSFPEKSSFEKED